MNHEQCKAKLDIYLDGELPTADAQELDLHLRECPACAAEAVRRMQWKKAVKAAGEKYMRTGFSPLGARSAKRRQVPSSSVAAWAIRPRAWWPAAAVALAAVLVLAGISVHRNTIRETQNSQLIAELVDLHVATLASANPVDVISTDRHTVRPWFAGKIPFTFDLPDLKDTPFELIGGRVAYLDQYPGAELLVRVRRHQVSVFILPQKAVPQDLQADSANSARSFHLESFDKGGLRYFIIGDVAGEEMQQLADRFRM